MLKNQNKILLFLLLFSNCMGAIADKGGKTREPALIPSATIIRSENYKVLGQGEGESSAFFIWGLIPVTNPLNIEYAMSQAVQKIPGGDSIVNVAIWHETHYYFPLGTVSVVKVKGDIVSLKETIPLFDTPSKKKVSNFPAGGGISVGGKKKSSGGITVGGKE